MGTYNSNFISGGQIYALTIKCMYAWSTICIGSFSLTLVSNIGILWFLFGFKILMTWFLL